MQIDGSGAQGAVDQATDRYAGMGIVVTGEMDNNDTQEQPEAKPKETEQDDQGQEHNQDDESEGEDRKRRRGGFQKKLERKDAEIEELKRQLADKQDNGKKPEPRTLSDDKPQLDSYETYEDYYEALTDWKVEQRFKDKDAKAKEAQAREESGKKLDTYNKRAAEFKKTTPDFEKVIADFSEDVDITPAMEHAILESEVGPQLAYYLANNPDEAESIAKMGVMQMNRYLGKLEAKLESNPPKVIKTTNAPAPISPVGKASSASTKTINDEMSYEEYRKMRGK